MPQEVPPRLLDVAGARLLPLFRRGLDELGRRIGEIRGLLVPHGVIGGSVELQQVVDAMKGEYERRAELAWETWKGLLEAEGILYQVSAEEVVALVRGHFERDSADVEELFRRVLPKRPTTTLSSARASGDTQNRPLMDT